MDEGGTTAAAPEARQENTSRERRNPRVDKAKNMEH
jgi:hypothetical protein